MMKNIIRIILLLLTAALTSTAYATGGKNELALSGYDVVSYFTHNKAEKGNGQHTHVYKGREYHFTSEAQKRMFIESPERYLPQFDGYCAYGVTYSKKLKASPEAWKIVDGKLYLNLDKDFLADWSKDIAANIEEGNDQWELIKDIPAEELN